MTGEGIVVGIGQGLAIELAIGVSGKRIQVTKAAGTM
jgi:hypothetical protein